MALSVEASPMTLGRRTAEQRLVKVDVKSRICRGRQPQSRQVSDAPGHIVTEGGCALSSRARLP